MLLSLHNNVIQLLSLQENNMLLPPDNNVSPATSHLNKFTTRQRLCEEINNTATNNTSCKHSQNTNNKGLQLYWWELLWGHCELLAVL